MAKVNQWIVTIKNNPNFCGKGAGGVQFANGEAKVTSKRMADWFKAHKGYVVKAEKADESGKAE